MVTSPSSSSWRSASRTGVRLTPNSSPIFFSFNSSSVAYFPDKIFHGSYETHGNLRNNYPLPYMTPHAPIVTFNSLQHFSISSTNSLSVNTVTRPSSYCLSTHTFTFSQALSFVYALIFRKMVIRVDPESDSGKTGCVGNRY